MGDRFANMPPHVRKALQDWRRLHPEEARKLERFDRAQDRDDGTWNHRRQPDDVDRSEPPLTPPVKARRVAGQKTAVARGAESLMSDFDVWVLDNGRVDIVDVRPGLGRRLGPGRAASMAAPTVCGYSLREDWNRAVVAWGAAILHLDFYAVFRAIKQSFRERSTLEQQLEQWSSFDQGPLLEELLAGGLKDDALIRALRERTPRPRPPAALLPALSLASAIGHGAHLLAARTSTLDLDGEERSKIPSDAVRVADLTQDQQRWLLHRREQQVFVRRMPALPQERGSTSDERRGTALADLSFGGHPLSRRFSSLADPPRRAVDVASRPYLDILYRSGPDLAALAAAGAMLDRAPGTLRRLARDARVHRLVQRENTKQGP